MSEKLDDRLINGDHGFTEPAPTTRNETGRWMAEQVLHGTGGAFAYDKRSYLFSSLMDFVTVAQWWAKQKKTAALPLEEDERLALGFRVDLGDGGILLRATGDIALAIRESNPGAFAAGGFAPNPFDLQGAMRRMAEIEEQAKSAAPRRSA
jgi:hypothetical protein